MSVNLNDVDDEESDGVGHLDVDDGGDDDGSSSGDLHPNGTHQYRSWLRNGTPFFSRSRATLSSAILPSICSA